VKTEAPARRIKWRYASPIIFVHLVSLLAVLPWFFSWSGVVLALVGCYGAF
jgi:stearoyl-CoA desaturase (delta-9 desaturase)